MKGESDDIVKGTRHVRVEAQAGKLQQEITLTLWHICHINASSIISNIKIHWQYIHSSHATGTIGHI